jgi:hypothetical protein
MPVNGQRRAISWRWSDSAFLYAVSRYAVADLGPSLGMDVFDTTEGGDSRD